MSLRAHLFALICLVLNGCGTDCPSIDCEDVVNVIFSGAQSGDYTVVWGGDEHVCAGGEPQSEGLISCGASGFVVAGQGDTLALTVQGGDWSGTLDASLDYTPITDAQRADCTYPCGRAEALLMVTP
ncbi:MAG: hypothetical protein VYB65_09305 [Myxococcota bacterium]|nr:hypothetical protein [Myxococcota bacterium]